MKSISAEAMAAIEAGEAIVTGALEIYTPGRSPVAVPEATDVILTWQQSGDDFPVAPDSGYMKISYYDEAGTLLVTDTADNLNTTPGVWTLRTLESSTPAGAVRLRIFMHFDRNSGAVTQQDMDSIALSIGGSNIPLTNPGAELGDMTGWIQELGIVTAVTSHGDAPGPHAGTYFFAPGENNIHSYYQDVFLSEVVPVEPGVVEAALRVWGGYGPITLDSAEYQGVGDRGLVQQTAGAVGGVAQGMELTLSRLEPNLLTLLDADEIKGGAAVMRRLIFASDGKTLLDYDIWDRGRIDAVSTVETIGAGAAIKVSVESAARGLGRSGQRMRSDSDQRLINPNDGYFRKAAYAGEKMLYWGGKKPKRTGDAVPLDSGGRSFSLVG